MDHEEFASWARKEYLKGRIEGPREAFAQKPEWERWSSFTDSKIQNAPVPSPADVAKARLDIKLSQRHGGESRGGSAEKRRAQRLNLFNEFGGEEQGYVVCPWTGLKMHWTSDPAINTEGLPKFERGKIFTKYQGGGYQLHNLIPESFEANRKRGSQPLRKENLD